MKRLSDYQDDDAFEILADLLEPVSKILADKEIKKIWAQPKIVLAEYIFKNHKKEATEIIRTIDKDVMITPVSIIKCVLDILTDIQNDPAISDFFKSAEQENEEAVTFGSAMENIEESGQ